MNRSCIVITVTHVLVYCVKSFRAYNVKSSSTLFSDNIEWKFEISFPCAWFNSLLGYNLTTKSWDHQKRDFENPCIMKLKNAFWCMVYCFENHLLGYLLNSKCIKIALNIYIAYWILIQAFKTLVQVEINKVLRESGVEDCHLVAGFENNRSGGSRFERVGLQKLKGNGQFGFPLRNFLFLILLTPQCTFGTKKHQKHQHGNPLKTGSLSTWWKRVKEYSFNHGTERSIVEDCIAVILPPQLTL